MISSNLCTKKEFHHYFVPLKNIYGGNHVSLFSFSNFQSKREGRKHRFHFFCAAVSFFFFFFFPSLSFFFSVGGRGGEVSQTEKNGRLKGGGGSEEDAFSFRLFSFEIIRFFVLLVDGTRKRSFRMVFFCLFLCLPSFFVVYVCSSRVIITRYFSFVNAVLTTW